MVHRRAIWYLLEVFCVQLRLTREFPAHVDEGAADLNKEDGKGHLLVVAPETFALRAGPRPEDKLLEICDGEMVDEYLRLADGFGLACPQVEAIRLRHLLAAEGTILYDRSRVKDYLDRKCGGEFLLPGPATADRPTPTWGWRPLRQQDVRSHVKLGPRSLPSRSDEILETIDVYDKPLPLGVLRTAVRIQQQFPNARFFASDRLRSSENDPLHEHQLTREASVDGPFLAVQLSALGELFVVERWDAPTCA